MNTNEVIRDLFNLFEDLDVQTHVDNEKDYHRVLGFLAGYEEAGVNIKKTEALQIIHMMILKARKDNNE